MRSKIVNIGFGVRSAAIAPTANGGHIGGTALTGAGPRPVTQSDPIPSSAGRRILARHGRSGLVAVGAGSTGLASHEDGQDRHLIEQPMLGRCGSGTGWPARVSSMAARSSSPVTGLPLPGVDWSNAPR